MSQSRSISDDDLCSLCKHCDYKPGDMSTCEYDRDGEWPGETTEDGYVYECNDFEPPNKTRVALGNQAADDEDEVRVDESEETYTSEKDR